MIGICVVGGMENGLLDGQIDEWVEFRRLNRKMEG
jgi:hypothetical protein